VELGALADGSVEFDVSAGFSFLSRFSSLRFFFCCSRKFFWCR